MAGVTASSIPTSRWRPTLSDAWGVQSLRWEQRVFFLSSPQAYVWGGSKRLPSIFKKQMQRLQRENDGTTKSGSFRKSDKIRGINHSPHRLCLGFRDIFSQKMRWLRGWFWLLTPDSVEVGENDMMKNPRYTAVDQVTVCATLLF